MDRWKLFQTRETAGRQRVGGRPLGAARWAAVPAVPARQFLASLCPEEVAPARL